MKTSEELKYRYRLTGELLQKGYKFNQDKNLLHLNYKINNDDYNFELKKKTSDALVFHQIIIKEEFKNVINYMMSKSISCNLMIDAGANIGLTTIYFKSFFHNLKIFSLEPSEEVFSRLERNIQINNLQNVTLINKGIWSHSTRLKGDYSFLDGLDWSFRLVEAKENDQALFEVCSISDLITEYKMESIDFLKMDIEGGESEVFKSNANMEWLAHVKVIAIEIHDQFADRVAIEKILISNQFDLSFSGELTIGLNRNLIK